MSLPEYGFLDILERMQIRPSFLDAVKESGLVATQFKYQVDGKVCVGKWPP